MAITALNTCIYIYDTTPVRGKTLFPWRFPDASSLASGYLIADLQGNPPHKPSLRHVWIIAGFMHSVIAEGSEAEVWIKSLHSIDDAEVYNIIKNSRPQLESWQNKAIEDWKAQHPGEEPEKNWNLSMDGLMKNKSKGEGKCI